LRTPPRHKPPLLLPRKFAKAIVIIHTLPLEEVPGAYMTFREKEGS
jgi:hypothetical protein